MIFSPFVRWCSYIKLCLIGVFSIFVTSCCKTCFIARSELTGFNTSVDKNGTKVSAISAGDKKVEISPDLGGQVLLYSVSGDNLILDNAKELSSLHNDIGIFSEVYRNGSSEPIEPGASKLIPYRPDKILFISNYGDYFKLSRTIKMNLENGDLHISGKLLNVSHHKEVVENQNILNMKSGGFLIIPTNVISKYKNGFTVLDETKSTGDYQKNDDILIVDTNNNKQTLVTDSKAGWIGYIKNDVLMIVKYPYYHNYRYKNEDTLKFRFDRNILKIIIFSPEFTVKNSQALYTSLTIAVMKLGKPVKTLEQVENALRKISIPLLLRR